MPDDVLLNKAAIIERCISRITEEYAGSDTNLFANITKQDSIILNLQRACEASIDLAMHIVRKRRLGVPQESRDAFELLQSSGLLDPDLVNRMKRMVGFRNVAIHDYTKLNLELVKVIITKHLNEFRAFVQAMMGLEEGQRR
jgi:uncharacterized protein YutE (UPF0331/DUF86 family)